MSNEPDKPIPMVTLTDDEIRVIMSAANVGWSEGSVSKLDEPVLATGLSKLKAMLRTDAFAPNECKAGHHEWGIGKPAVCKHCGTTQPQRRSCNRHDDCGAADEKARAAGRLSAEHCHDECCEECFGY